MKTAKKLLIALLVIAIAVSSLGITASAQSLGYEIGATIGAIIFSPFILVDLLLYSILGVHLIYPQWN